MDRAHSAELRHDRLLWILLPALTAWSFSTACSDDGASDTTDVPDVVDGGDADADGDADVPEAEVPDAPDGEVAACVDIDGDGHGPGCALGGDCDDADPTVFDTCASCVPGGFPPPGCACLPSPPYDPTPCYEGPPGTAGVGQCAAGTRACVDGHLVYECTGQVLPAEEEFCGDDRDNNCNGLGDDEAWGPCSDCDMTCNTSGPIPPSPTDPGATGLEANPDGDGVVLGVDDLHAAFVWVPNTDEGSVSKLDIATGVELGRYRVGQTGTSSDAPSRTAVDGVGDLYVANQANVSTVMTQGSVTKIAGDPSHCVDRNRNGTIETSDSATRLLLGTDECVLWTAPVGAPGATPRAVAIYAATAGAVGSPWVGTWNEQRFYRLDPNNGSVVSTVDVEVNPFGALAAPGGWIWISGRAPDPGAVQRFNAASGGLDPVVLAPSECDPYGIAVDGTGRVWIGGTRGSVCGYDPVAGSWITVATPYANATGVAVSGTDVLWAVSYDATAVSLSQFPVADPSLITSTDVPGDTTYAVAVDRFDHVWTVNYSSSTVTRFSISSSETAQFPTGRGPVAYGDFTGLERTIVSTSGSWSEDFERCDVADEDRWGQLVWSIDTPGGSSVTIAAASAATTDGLDTATPITLAELPPEPAAPVDIEAAFAAASATSYAHLRVMVSLVAGPGGESPVVRNVEVRWHCADGG